MRSLIFAAAATVAACAHAAPPQPFDARPFAGDGLRTEPDTLFRGSFAEDGDAFYFFRKVTPGEEDYQIFVARRDGEGWGAARRVDLGGDHSDLYPAVSPDGGTLVFSSYRPLPDGTPAENANLWMARRSGDSWGAPEHLDALSRPERYDAGPRFLADGRLLFGSTAPDWRSNERLAAAFDGRNFSKAQLEPIAERWESWRADEAHVWDVVLSPDGDLALLDVSELVDGRRGPTDQWYAWRDGDGWTEPRPLQGGVNTPDAYENFALFSPDGRTILFDRGFETYFEVSTAVAAPR